MIKQNNDINQNISQIKIHDYKKKKIIFAVSSSWSVNNDKNSYKFH